MVLTLDPVLIPVMLLNYNYWYMYITFIVMITEILLLVSCIYINISYQGLSWVVIFIVVISFGIG